MNPKNHPDAFENRFLPGLAIDAVIFGFHEKELKVLLLQYRNTDLYALPGGFIRKEENLDDAARRTLEERTGLKRIYMEQFHTFGDTARHDREPLKKIMAATGLEPDEDHWLLHRFISVGYYALVDYTKTVPRPDELSQSCAWYDLASLPPLIQDHGDMVQKALTALRDNLDRKLIGFSLMPETFTMGDLQSLYETVLGEKLRRTSFQRKMLHLKILERVAKKWTGAPNKAPYLYRFASEQQEA